jgi:uncharacterized protein (UPF0147 family)
MKEVLDKVRLVAVRTLTRHVVAALDNSALQIEAQAMQFTNAKLPPIREESRAIAERFMTLLNAYFDALTSFRAKEEEDESAYDQLSLVDHDYLEAILAMEGMVNHLRNSDRPEYVRLTTRLDSLFPNTTIDETNNPLDPEQIGDCFNEAIRPLGLKAHYLLTIYREFNKTAFHNMESVLAEANEVLIEIGVMPNLDMRAKNRELAKQKRDAERSLDNSQGSVAPDRSRGKTEITRKIQETVESAKPDENQAELFSMMQTLVRGLADQQRNQSALPVNIPVTTSHQTADLQTENENLKLQQAQLISVLNNLQSRLNLGDTSITGPSDSGIGDSSIGESISQTLEQSSSSGDIGAIDVQSSDAINLVTLLYKEIWNDDSLPLIMKELIGRTQISIMKIALSDTGFFDDEQHPGRVILNEFAMAGIAWTEKETLERDPVYSKVRELVERLLAEENANKNFVQGLINELREIKNDFSPIDAALEQRIRETDDPSERPEDVHEFVRQKVKERVLRDDLDPSIQNLLDTHFHNFLVQLIMKEGPGGSSWKPVMSTIDVLLWTVKADKLPGDKSRFEKINPRLLDNIEKALEIGGASKSKRKKILRQLKQVQQYSFHMAEISGANRLRSVGGAADNGTADAEPRRERNEPPSLPRDDPYLRRIDKLPIGTWFAFKGAAGVPVRCKLASKIDSIDKLFFVNSKGEKAVELTRMRLAQELKAGSVKILTEGSLVGRAMESVISNLRDTSHSQEADAAAN